MEPNILPAFISTNNIIHPGASSQEFQKTLYQWFEKSGLFNELRSYLRVQLINKLRNTNLTKNDTLKKNCSLAKQSLNLVIAEHLIKEDYHYTLSVFSTEVPHQLPLDLFENNQKKWKFDKESVSNLLELIGIGKYSKEAAATIEYYFQHNLSLLSCILFRDKKETEIALENQGLEDDNVLTYVNKTLSTIRIPKDVIVDLETKIKFVLKQEKRNNTALKNHYTKLLEDLRKELSTRDDQIKDLVEQNLKLVQENEKVKEENKKYKKRLSKVTLAEEVLQQQKNELEHKCSELRKLEYEMKAERNKKCELEHCGDMCKNSVEIISKLRHEIRLLKNISDKTEKENEKLHSKLKNLLKDLHNSQDKIDLLAKNKSPANSNPQDNVVDLNPETDTEDVLIEVHQQLQQLEKESETLELMFQQISFD